MGHGNIFRQSVAVAFVAAPRFGLTEFPPTLVVASGSSSFHRKFPWALLARVSARVFASLFLAPGSSIASSFELLLRFISDTTDIRLYYSGYSYSSLDSYPAYDYYAGNAAQSGNDWRRSNRI